MSDSLANTALPAALPVTRMSFWAAVRRGLRNLLLCLFLVTMVTTEGYAGKAGYQELMVNRAIGGDGFRLAAWEVDAWRQKADDALNRPGSRLSPQEQHDLVVAYFDGIGQVRSLSSKIEALYSDPKQTTPQVTATELQRQLDGLRADQARRRPAVEQILQDQVGSVLRDIGLASGALVLPPVLFRFTESPDVLIISPRDRITLERSDFVQPGGPVARMEQIEGQVEKTLGVSALVEGTGGFAAYPTMVIETSDLEWVLTTIAHEWFHTYVTFQPLGWHYLDSGDTRALNETAASIFGDELGPIILAKYYPERVVSPPAETPKRAAKDGGQPAAPKFSFEATMRATRLHVDDLLAHGKIAEAESYMEAQREAIVSHGYVLRKLNQAYFAFHGSYAGGAAGADPIGEKLRALRARSTSLLQFVHLVSRVTTVQQLDAVLAGIGS